MLLLKNKINIKILHTKSCFEVHYIENQNNEKRRVYFQEDNSLFEVKDTIFLLHFFNVLILCCW